MKHLFHKKRALKAEIENAILNAESKGSRRVETFNQVTPLTQQFREIDSQIEAARKRLGEVEVEMLRQLGSHIQQRQLQEANDLIGALQKLAVLSYEEDNFPWEDIMDELQKYSAHPECALPGEGFLSAVSELSKVGEQ